MTRPLYTSTQEERRAAAEALLCSGIHIEARRVAGRFVFGTLQDWLDHIKGSRRRAHEYRRWALEAEAAGDLERYRRYRADSERQWRQAWDALARAKRDCRGPNQ